MILFLNEDRAYLSWVAHHRAGFVLDGRSKPRLSRLVLHRATCPAIKSAHSRRVHWTTGAKLKVCSLQQDELSNWAGEQAAATSLCPECRPDLKVSPEREVTRPSKLARDILDYILDAAVIHLEHENPPYHLTIGDIAACFAKTPGQLADALHRLSEGGLVTTTGSNNSIARQIVYPTTRALQTLPAFAAAKDVELQVELAKLHSQ